jgi:hypothetical protein
MKATFLELLFSITILIIKGENKEVVGVLRQSSRSWGLNGQFTLFQLFTKLTENC